MDKNSQNYNAAFLDGLLYAVQQIVLYRNRESAVFLIQESGISREEFEAAQKESGYENETMAYLFETAFLE